MPNEELLIDRELPSKPVILILTGYYLPGYKAGGILRNIINTVDHLCEEYDFRIVTRNRDLGDTECYPEIETGKWQWIGNAQIYYLPKDAETLGGVRKLIKETNHDVIYLTSFFDPLTILALVNRKLRRIPCRPVIVAPFGEFAWASLGQKFTKKLAFIIFARLFGLYDNLIWRVSSVYEAKDLSRVMKPPPASIMITGDPPLKASLELGLTTKILDTGNEPHALRIVFLSRISREKNLDVALRILQRIELPVIFDIYGPAENGAYWKECQDLMAHLPGNVAAKYCGIVHPNKILEVFGQYDLFLFPTGGEAYGNVIAESLISGTPVLISTATPWRNLQADGLGWDLDLNNIDAFVDVIRNIASQSKSQRLLFRNSLRKRAQDRLFDANVLESNRRLFETQLVNKSFRQRAHR